MDTLKNILNALKNVLEFLDTKRKNIMEFLDTLKNILEFSVDKYN